MSDFNATYQRIMINEGGYNRPAGASGETYKGIDRSYFPSWSGWAIIDQYKAQYGTPREESIISSPALENAVKAWYYAYLSPLVGIQVIDHQVIADFVADFAVHKQYDAIKVINAVVNNLSANVTTTTLNLTLEAINFINANAVAFYTKLYNARIQYYQNPASFGSSLRFSQPYIISFINRVKTFPATITVASNIIETIKSTISAWLQ